MTTNFPDDQNGPGAVPGTPAHPSTDPLATGTTGPTTRGTSGTGSGAAERTQEAAGTAKQEAGHVAGVAQQEVGKVAAEAKDQLRGLVDDATGQVHEQSRVQKSRLTEVLRTFGDDLDDMAQRSEGSGPANQLVQQASQQARSLASHLDDREPQDLVEDVRRFARRRPGTFLLGAVVAGVVAGRLTRGAKEARTTDSTPTGTGTSPAPRTVGHVGPPATVGTVSPAPVSSVPGHDPELLGEPGAPVGTESSGTESYGAGSFDQPGPGRDVLVDPLDTGGRA